MNNKLKIGGSLVLWMMLELSSSAQTLSLSQAYSLALEHEPKLRSMAAQTEATEELINQSKAKLRPQLQGSLSWGYYGYDAKYLNKPIEETYSSYSISASQPLYHPEHWRGLEESKAHVQGAHYNYVAHAQQLGVDVAKAYFQLMRTYRNVDLLKSQKHYYEIKLNEQQEMLTVGLTTKVDLLEAKVHYNRALSEWISEQNRLNVAKLKVEYFIGEKVDNLTPFDFATIPLSVFEMERTAWEEKLGDNPSVKASEFSTEMARHQVAMRQYEHYPKVDLSLTRKETYTQDTYSHKYDNQAIIQMSIPIYQGGYAQSKVREGLKLLDSATYDAEYTRQNARLTFETSWSERALMVGKIRVLRESEKSAELYVTSVEQAQAAGLKSFLQLLDARAKLYQVKLDLVDAGYDLINNQLSLMDNTGTLNSDNINKFESSLHK